MIKEEDDDDDDLLLLFLFVFLIEFTFMRLMRKGNNQRSKHKSSCSSSNIRGIIVCGSCGDRTTATESKQVECPYWKYWRQCMHQYGHTPCLPIINSINNRWNSHTHCVALLFVVSLLVSCGEPQRREREIEVSEAKRQRPKKTVYVWYSVVILNAFPLLTVDKKLS